MADPLDDYREKLKSGASPGALQLRKQYPASITSQDDDYVFTISNGSVDREGDQIDIAGWETANYLAAGGPVLWAHQSRMPPIAKATWVRSEGGALKAGVQFMPPGKYEFADTIRALVDFGALRATSVGFMPLPDGMKWNADRGGIDFSKQELLEFSIVPVPANPEALLDAKSAGIDIAPLRAWAETVLYSCEPGQWLPKAQASAVFKLLAGGGATSRSEPCKPAPAPEPAPFLLSAKDIETATVAVLKELIDAEIRRLSGRID